MPELWSVFYKSLFAGHSILMNHKIQVKGQEVQSSRGVLRYLLEGEDTNRYGGR